MAEGKISSIERGNISNLLKKMNKFDRLLTATGDKYWSNSIHQIRVFLLGIVLLYKCGFKSKIEESPISYNSLDFVWLYASLFHDIGYLIEKLNDIQNKINDWTNDFQLFTSICSISFTQMLLLLLKRAERLFFLLHFPEGQADRVKVMPCVYGIQVCMHRQRQRFLRWLFGINLWRME